MMRLNGKAWLAAEGKINDRQRYLRSHQSHTGLVHTSQVFSAPNPVAAYIPLAKAN